MSSPSSSSPTTSSGGPRKSIVPQVIGIFLFALLGGIVILIYFVFMSRSPKVVEKTLETCSIHDKHASDFIDSKPADSSVWVYNLSNPHQYALGATPELHETGPYGFSLDQVRFNPVFSQKEGTFEYDTYYSTVEDNTRSCSGCTQADKLKVPYYAYQSTIGLFKNEGILLLSLSCTSTQIGLISSPVPYCSAIQRGNASFANCKCCRPSPLAPAGSPAAPFCKDLARSTTFAGGLISFLSMHDNGLKLNSKATGFALSNGVYTNLVRELSVGEILWGHGSVVLGSVNTAAALALGNLATPAQKLAITSNFNTTVDLLEACSFNTTTCPTVPSLVAGNPVTWRTATCHGEVPSVDVLISRGISSVRAEQLRYLEGVSCRPVTPSLILAAALTKDPSPKKSFQCVDGSHQLPCCLKSFSAPTFQMRGQGIGCVQWIAGLIQVRKVFSDAEAYLALAPTKERMATACAPKGERFQIQMYKDIVTSRSWYTPAHYSYPNMTWADNTIMKTALSSPSQKNWTTFNISGDVFGIHEGKGFKAQFLSSELTESTDPLKETLSLWVPFRRAASTYSYVKNSVLKGITTNYYEYDLDLTHDPQKREQQQRLGHVPYQNMQSVYYSAGGRPIIMSAPNFYGSEPDALQQQHNHERKSNRTTGVSLYRTRSTYDENSVSITPELITTQTWNNYRDNYGGNLYLEPATGLTLEGTLVNQMSTYTWNCNPSIDPTCSFFFYNYSSSSQGKLCYHSGPTSTTGSFFPCSANNVFTPYVMGGKVLPIFWLKAEPKVSSTVFKALHTLQRKEYVASIIVIVIPVLAFIGMIVMIISLIIIRRKIQQVSATVVEMKPIDRQGV